MRTMAAVLRKAGDPWEVTEIDLDPPREHEVLLRMAAAGLCHSDEHFRLGDAEARLPIVGGHEGAGVVEAVGPGVTRVAEGDHVACSFIPVCGACRYCQTGRSSLCDQGANAGVGCLPDGSFRFHEDGVDIGGICALGTFSRHLVVSEWSVAKIDDDLPFDIAALVSCGVTTGWGSSVYAGGVRAGDVTVVFGVGGVGINAVQGARYAGARAVVAVDPVPLKLDAARRLGATHATSDPDEAQQLVVDLTRGQLADQAILTVGVMSEDVVDRGLQIIGKGGTVVITGMGPADDLTIKQNSMMVTLWQKRIQGALFGSANPLYDIPRLLALYRAGDLKLDELISRRYQLEQVNQGYEDMLEGRNIRGVIEFE